MRISTVRNIMRLLLRWPCLLAPLLWPFGCAQQERPAPANNAAVTQGATQETDPVLRQRQEKDRTFKLEPNSPIPEEDRLKFQGLTYFPLSPGFRFTVKLNRHPRPARVRLGTNTGEMRDALRYGYFEFQVEGETCTVQVYRTEDSQAAGKPYLFIPFRDATSGTETYGGGRYLDLHENTSGIYDLDFNRAYNPLCAYRKDYSCPVPPEENRLPVAIRAGEKTYPLAR